MGDLGPLIPLDSAGIKCLPHVLTGKAQGETFVCNILGPSRAGHGEVLNHNNDRDDITTVVITTI